MSRTGSLSFDECMMAECIRLARTGEGRVSPNPMVGAVLVKDGKIVSRGFHHYFGGPHAEVDCLGKYRGNPASTTLYVNLEPCSYYGKTPPCTELIRARKIPRVVVGVNDPNPLISGRGIRSLRRSGVEVVTGVLREKAHDLNRHFFCHITAGRPYVHLKIAQTLDGRIARRQGQRTTISGPEAIRMVHHWRGTHDAVLVGAGTVHADDPELNIRYGRGNDPHVIIVDGSLSVHENARVFSSAGHRKVIIATSLSAARKHPRKVSALRSKGVLIREFAARTHHLNMLRVLRMLYRREQIGSILVEGGSNVFSQFLGSDMLDELSIFFSPVIFGTGPLCISDESSARQRARRKIRRMSIRNVGRDVLLRTYFT